MSEKVTIEVEDTNKISDGYHTFGELYAHRIELWIALCRVLEEVNPGSWRSQVHSDGSVMAGWFVLGYRTAKGMQITYHLPMDRWSQCTFAQSRDRAPKWDGHSAADVLGRIRLL